MTTATSRGYTISQWRQVCIHHLRTHVAADEVEYVQQYIDEAESENGEAYWSAFFPTTTRLQREFDVFLREQILTIVGQMFH